MNDLKFGWVEIDTSREINRWRLEIDRVLFRKSLLISEDGMAKFWQKNWTAEMHEKRQQCRSIDASYFFRRICNKKKNLFTEKQAFEESLRLGKVVKNLEISWINNETIIELFGLQMMWEIM